MIDNNTFITSCPYLRESKGDLTPEQEEMAIYERSVDVYGKSVVIGSAIESLTALVDALSEHNKNAGNKTEHNNTSAVNTTRALAAIALNQLEVIFGDNSFVEYCHLEYLREAMEDKDA